MADQKISAMSAASPAVGDFVPIVQGGENKKAEISAIVALAAGGGSVTSTELSAVSAQAASAISQLLSIHDVLSNRVSANSGVGGGGSVTSTEVSAGDAAVSLQAASALSQALSVLSVTDAGLSVRINTVSNVASDAVSIANAASNAVSIVSNALSNEISNRASAVNAVSTVASNAVSIANAASNAASIVSAAVETLSAKVVSVSAQLVSIDTHAGAASAAATSVDSRLNTVSNQVSVLSLRLYSSQLTNAVSVSGVISTLSTYSTRMSAISAAVTSVDTHANAASAAATSADAHANTVSGAVETLSAKVVSVSAQLVSIDAHAAAASAAATSVDSRVNTVSNLVSVNLSAVINASTGVSIAAISVMSATKSAVANVSATSAGGGSATGLQNVVDALSNKISTIVAGAMSITSAEYVSTLTVVSNLVSAVTKVSARNTAGTSVQGLQSVVDAFSNRISAAGGGGGSVTSNEFSNALSAGDVISDKVSALSGQLVMPAAAATVSAAGLTNVSGYSASFGASTIYEVHAKILYSTSAAQVVGFGWTWPAMVRAAGHGQHMNIGQNANQSTISTVMCGFDQAATGSVILSVFASVAGVVGTKMVMFDGMFVVSNAGGTLQLQAKASAGTGAIVIERGSMIRVMNLGAA